MERAQQRIYDIVFEASNSRRQAAEQSAAWAEAALLDLYATAFNHGLAAAAQILDSDRRRA